MRPLRSDCNCIGGYALRELSIFCFNCKYGYYTIEEGRLHHRLS
jgi:hypothetical protein